MTRAKVIVTGAGGFIGKALVARLLADDVEVIALNSVDGDIQNPDTLSPYIDASVTRVFHLAARTFVPDSWLDPQSFYTANVLGTTSVLEFCRNERVPLTMISAYVYGQPHSLPIDESAVAQPNNPYAVSKYLAEQACRHYANIFKVPITVVRPFNIYGVGQDMKFLIPSIVRQTMYEESIEVKDLLPRRDYLYLDDLIDALIATMRVEAGFEIYNVGYGESLSVKDVIDEAQKVAGTSKNIISSNMVREQEIPDVVADISKINRDLKWHPATKFEDGLRKIFDSLQGLV